MAKLSQIKLGSTTYDIGAAWGNISGKPSTFPPSSHNHDDVYAKLTSMNNMVHSSNEWTVVPSGYSGALWLNYRTCGGTNGDITEYNFGNGKGGTAGVKLVADTFTGKAATAGYADSAGTCTSLSTNAGSTTKAIYFTGGKPAQCNTNIAHNSMGIYGGTKLTSETIDGFLEANITKWAPADATAVGNNDGVVISYGWSSTYGAQMWLDDGSGQASMKIRNRGSGGASWNDWRTILTDYNFNSYAPTLTGGGASGTWGINVTGSAGSVAWANVTGKPSSFTPSSHTHSYHSSMRTVSGNSHAEALKNEFTNYKGSVPRNSFINYYSSAYGNGSCYMGYFLNGYDANPYGGFFVAHYGTPYYVGIQSGSFSQHQLWKSGDAVTGAVWNDYAECRESDCEDFGYVLMETGNDSLAKTTERLSHFAGISSDTWGFSQGETEKAKTPIAVAGRVLAYPFRDRNEYKPGDCVCAAPGGTVDIMTREEVINWPDRIVGTVSFVPDYEEWGGGNDREAVKVNGRIWIKVR